jgi:hypothetical protein
MNKALVLSMFLLCCGPDWNDCLSCRSGEVSAESIDGGEQIPVVVNVSVNVGQSQTQNQSTYPSSGSGGDGGSGEYEEKRRCDYGSHNSGHGSRCRIYKKCVKEATQCW